MLLKKLLIKAPWCMVGLCTLILVGCGKKTPTKTAASTATLPIVQTAAPAKPVIPPETAAGLQAIPLLTEKPATAIPSIESIPQAKNLENPHKQIKNITQPMTQAILMNLILM